MDVHKAHAEADKMRRRIDACTKGLLEANNGNAKDPASTIVSPLHPSVKDHLYHTDIWTRICQASPLSFNIDARFLNCSIMRLKTTDRSIGLDKCSLYAPSAITHLKKAALDDTAAARYDHLVDQFMRTLCVHQDTLRRHLPSHKLLKQLGWTWNSVRWMKPASKACSMLPHAGGSLPTSSEDWILYRLHYSILPDRNANNGRAQRAPHIS